MPVVQMTKEETAKTYLIVVTVVVSLVLMIAFPVLKLLAVIDWSWWWITAPIWITLSFCLAIAEMPGASVVVFAVAFVVFKLSGGIGLSWWWTPALLQIPLCIPLCIYAATKEGRDVIWATVKENVVLQLIVLPLLVVVVVGAFPASLLAYMHFGYAWLRITSYVLSPLSAFVVCMLVYLLVNFLFEKWGNEIVSTHHWVGIGSSRDAKRRDVLDHKQRDGFSKAKERVASAVSAIAFAVCLFLLIFFIATH